MNVLDAITAKLDRAHEHLEVFDDAVREFLKTRPHTYSSEFKSKGENVYDWVFTIHIQHEIPLRISAIFGDGIQNVRTTLDYLAYQLAVANVGLDGDLRGTAFPIFSCKERFLAIDNGKQHIRGRVWTSSGLYKIRSIDTRAQAIIECLQPYHGGDNVLLSHLQDLSDIDKHRHFHVVIRPPEDWVAGIPLGDGFSLEPLEGLSIRNRFLANPPFEDGAEVARFEIVVAPDFDFKVRVKHAIPGEVVLQEVGLLNDYAGHILAGLIGFVRKKVIPQFTPFIQ